MMSFIKEMESSLVQTIQEILAEDDKKWYPNFITHKKLEYCHTGKIGKHMKSGESSAEYEYMDPATGHKTGKRVWLRKSGVIEPD